MSFIEAQDLLSFVDGTGKEPKDFLETDDKGEIMNPEYVTWRRTDRLFKIKMIGTMTEDVLSPTTRLRTSRNIWMCLESLPNLQRTENFNYSVNCSYVAKGSKPVYVRN